jgi:hypothetical protein
VQTVPTLYCDSVEPPPEEASGSRQISERAVDKTATPSLLFLNTRASTEVPLPEQQCVLIATILFQNACRLFWFQ